MNCIFCYEDVREGLHDCGDSQTHLQVKEVDWSEAVLISEPNFRAACKASGMNKEQVESAVAKAKSDAGYPPVGERSDGLDIS